MQHWKGNIDDMPPDLRATFFDRAGNSWKELGGELDHWLKGDLLPALERIWWLVKYYPTDDSPKEYPQSICGKPFNNGWELIASTLAVFASRDEWRAGIKVLMDFASVDDGAFNSVTGDNVELVKWSEGAEKALLPWAELGIANKQVIADTFNRLTEMQNLILDKMEKRKAEEEDFENKHPWRGKGESYIVAYLMGRGYSWDMILQMPFNIWLLFTWHLEGVMGN